MKKHIFTLVFALLGSVCAWAQDYDFSAVCSTGQTLCYQIRGSAAVALVGYEGNMTGEITLPETVEYGGDIYNVTAIGDHAFFECGDLTGSLNIPNSVTELGNYAFNGCDGFNGTLSIGNSVTMIGISAFQGCIGFTGSLTIPNSVTSIGKYAFNGCSGFSGSLTIGNSVTEIKDNTFCHCEGFTGSLIIPNSVTSIGNCAFQSCRSFDGSLTIGSSVTDMDYWAFGFCSFLSIISKRSTPSTADEDCFCWVADSIPVYVPCGSSGAYSQAEGWNHFSNFHEFKPYDINLFSSDVTMGSVAFAQLPDCETGICKVKASPMPGFKFDYWMENGAQVSTEAEYSFVATADRTLTAYFSEILDVNSFFDTDLQLFPNPTCGIINVQCDGMKHIAVMNALGQVVYETEPTDAQSAQIDLSGFGSGMYVVRVVTENGLINRQVIITEQ
ncbi:MAG: leucine-rich repeat protein [Bacteroidales bacterium]|nr:leucine-rich repeat protein [Bacteroidales bacterium]